MATVDMTFGPGSSTIRTGAGGGGGVGGMDGVSGLLQQVLSRRMATAEEDRRRKLALEDEQAGDRATARKRDAIEYNNAAAARNAPKSPVSFGSGQTRGAPTRRPQIGSEKTGLQSQLEGTRAAAEMGQLESAMRGPAQRYITAGPGIVGGGLTNDLSRMNAFDRKNYLPDGSGLAAGPAEHDLGEEADRSGQFELRRRARAGLMEKMASGVQ